MFADRSPQIPTSMWRYIFVISLCIYSSAALFILHTSVGTYHQYDTVAYPKNVKSSTTPLYPKDFKSSKSFFEKARNQFKAVLGKILSGSQPQEENILSPIEMGSLCLLVYLDEYEQKLCSGSFPQEANLKIVVEEICHIFHILYNPVICNHNSTMPSKKTLDVQFIEVYVLITAYCKHLVKFVCISLHLGNEGMAGVCCKCLTGWSS